MKMKIALPASSTAIAAAALALSIAACGGGSHSASAAHQHTAAAAQSAPVLLTCAQIAPDLTAAVGDLKAQDVHYQEAWVSGGDSSDLQALITDTASATTGANQFNTDAATFNADASNYLAANSPELALGWQSGYSTVTNDINALATDCGQPTAPANTPQNS
jgi:hypothetical protein